MERGVFPRPEIEERLREFVLVRLFVNDRKPESRSDRWAAMLRDRFKTTAIPLYVCLGPDDTVLGTLAFPGGTVDGFARRLAALLDAARGK